MEYVRMIAMPWFNKLEVKRAENNGGDKTYTSMEELEADYTSGGLHPGEILSARTHSARAQSWRSWEQTTPVGLASK